MDPVAVNILPLYPKANREPDDLAGANNFRANDVNGLTRDNYIVKVDHHLGSYDKVTARYLYNSDNGRAVSVFPDPVADTKNNTDRHQQYWYGTWTHIFTPTLLHEFRFTFGNRINHEYSKGLGQNWPSKLGLKGLPDDAFPQFAAAGFTQLGASTQERRQFPIRQYQVVSHTSWIRSRHAVKFGGEARPAMN